MNRDSMADVCIVAEGTYPFVAGGVSSWIHNLVSALPTVTFRLLHVGVTPEDAANPSYDMPSNVLGVDRIYLQDFRPHRLRSRGAAPGDRDGAWESCTHFHDRFSAGEFDRRLFDRMFEALGDPERRGLRLEEVLESKRSWEFLQERYRLQEGDVSFIDYFWTWRFTHLPLLQMIQADLPPARVYHTVSSGYAGFLAAVAKKRLGVPMIITEHGIYIHERKLEIAQADWIHVEPFDGHRIRRSQGTFKQWWINLFRMMSQVCYAEADRIITISGVNQPLQLADGADPAKMSVIPNGVKLDRYRWAREVPRPSDEFVVGFVGRVVPIKDVKTFLRAIKIAATALPTLKAYVIGPTEEDEEYYADCRQLARLLDLEDRAIFTGRADVVEHYARMHLLVLTSLSEAQPLVILEAHCAGVPVVATRVGACDELLNGNSAADRALGPSGLLTPPVSPEATAAAIVQLARDPQLRASMVDAGIERVERHYSDEDLNRTYLELYEQLSGERWERTAEMTAWGPSTTRMAAAGS